MYTLDNLMQVKMFIDRGLSDMALNIFHYASELPAESGDALLAELGEAFALVIPPAVQATISDTGTIVSIEVTDLYDDELFFEKTLSLAGLNTSDVCPAFTAFSYRTNRVRGDIRRGQKRFGPVTEDQVLLGEINLPGSSTYVDVEDALGEQLISDDENDLFDPVIVKRIPYVTPGGKDAYRLPTQESEAEAFIASNWSIVTVTTQRTRKA